MFFFDNFDMLKIRFVFKMLSNVTLSIHSMRLHYLLAWVGVTVTRLVPGVFIVTFLMLLLLMSINLYSYSCTSGLRRGQE